MSSLEKTFLSIAVGLVVNAVYSSIYPATLLDGSPLWSWYSATVYQAVSFPILCYMILVDKGFRGVQEIASCSWGNAGEERCGTMVYEECLMYLVVSYFVKDMLVLLKNYYVNFHFIVHHFVCCIGTYVILSFPPNGGATAFCLGVVELELGSFAMSRYLLNPNSPFYFYTYVVIMTFSNMIAAFALPYVLFMESAVDIRQILLVVTSVVLSVSRQLALGNHCIQWYKSAGDRSKTQ